MNIKEIHLLNEKNKWFEQFRKGYSGGCSKKLPQKAFNESVCKFLVAYENGKEMGFIRIVAAETFGPEFKGDWELAEAYIKPPYRSNGVFRELLMHSMDFYNVKIVQLTEDRFFNNYSYYHSLGFVAFVSEGESTGYGLGYACFPEVLAKFKELGATLVR
jgi:GNAT superfamily N-acetyltransferase